MLQPGLAGLVVLRIRLVELVVFRIERAVFQVLGVVVNVDLKHRTDKTIADGADITPRGV